MKLIGQPIKHKTFGHGIVTAFTGGIMTICFQDSEKKFIYPDAFKNFLVLKDQRIQQSIQKQIEAQEAAILQKNELEQAERDRRQKLLNYKVAANSHAVFNISPEQARQVCQTYTVSTGNYISGCSKGQLRIAERMKPNSACLLTVRANGETEAERKIIGAFMVEEDFFGEDVQDGMIQGHPQYRLLVPDGPPMLFWETMNQKAPPRWGNAAFKYCSGDSVNQILFKLLERFDASAQKELAIDFYQYFCKKNSLRPLIPLEDHSEIL